MSTGTIAIQALQKVARDTFLSQSGDLTWGALYANMTWELQQPFGVYKNIPTVFLYKMSGQAAAKGLGSIKQWREPKIRADILCNTYADSEQTFEALRTAWITDFDYVNGNGSVGQAYLRQTGHIKYINIGESNTAAWETRGLVFRRIADITIMIGD